MNANSSKDPMSLKTALALLATYPDLHELLRREFPAWDAASGDYFIQEVLLAITKG